MQLWNLPSQLGFAHYEEVSFFTQDRVRISAWFIKQDGRSPTIILCHGLGTNRSDVVEIARILSPLDFNFLLFDFRAHGKSQGKVSSFGYREQRDVEAAIEYLNRREDLTCKEYGIFGISMGGSVAIMVAARNKQLEAVVADSPYIDLDESIITHLKFLLSSFGRFLGPFAVASYRLRFWIDSAKISPLKVIGRISPRAVFIINGAQDERMSARDAQRLYEAAKAPKQLWLVEGAGHLQGLGCAENKYAERLRRFFDSYLRGPKER